ncbi:MAG TPA: tetratricopeptide repeat protein [Bacteroidales bacterium]|nr:tetratricopeptide repeat protein [Bacteroidales bacterium]
MTEKNKSKKNTRKTGSGKKTTEKPVAIRHKWVWTALLLVLLTTFAVYFNAIKFDFLRNWDDNQYIYENAHIMGLQWENIKLFFTSFYVGNYQPVTMLFFAIEYKIGAGHASVFHLTNILLHLFNTLFVFIFIRKIVPKGNAVALITAAFFAVHPMHVESVAWISERKDVLYSFFFMISLILYAEYIKRPRVLLLVSAAILHILSCMSKSAAVILPLVMLLIDYYTGRKFRWAIIIEKIPFFVISLVFGYVATLSQKGAMEYILPDISLINRISLVSYSVFSYIYKAFIPVHLSAIHPYPHETGGMLPLIFYFSVLFTGIILFAVWFSRRWGKDGIFGFLFFLITIILVLQFLPFGAAIMADRYTYIPYIGLFFITGKIYEYVVRHLDKNHKKFNKVPFGLMILCFIIFSAISFARVQKWKNDEILFTDAMKKYPDCCVPYFNRGHYYSNYYAKTMFANDSRNRENYFNKAISDYENALKFGLNKADTAIAYLSMGNVRSDLGDYYGAIYDYDKVIKTDSKYLNAYINRGNARSKLMDFKGALEDFNKTLEIDSNNLIALINRGITKNNLNDYTGALSDFDKAASIDKNNYNVYNNRGFSRFMMKDYANAILDYDRAINIDKNNPSAYINRSYAKREAKDYRGELEDLDNIIALDPQNPYSYSNRGVAKFRINDYQGAMDDFTKAIEIDERFAKAYNDRGSARYMLKDYKGALEDYNKAIENDPQLVEAVENRNKVLKMLK